VAYDAIAAETARVVGPDEALALASEERLETGDHIPAPVQALHAFQNWTPTRSRGATFNFRTSPVFDPRTTAPRAVTL
jgi:hypothetical protein